MAKNEKKMEKVIGTNCYNCKFIADKEVAVDTKDLNIEGGIDTRKKQEMERAKKADLITLPGGTKVDVNSKKLLQLSSKNECYCPHVLRILGQRRRQKTFGN